MPKAQLALDARALLGEGPYWDSSSGTLYWIDIAGRSLHAFDPAGCRDVAVGLPSKPGAVVGRSGGIARDGLLMAMEDGFCFADPETGATSPILDPEPERATNRFNDGKCDSRGRFWAGSMDDSEKGRRGAFYRLGADLSCERQFDGVGISNGLAWSPDDRIMYYIDTPTRRVDAFDFDAEAGSIAGRRTAFEIPQGMGFPDGMTVDEEGMLWIALWMGWGLGRWDPGSGRLVEKLDLPVARCTSCAFGAKPGGSALDRLYITTASLGIGPGEASQPEAGGVFVYDPGLSGAPSRPFAG
jgi:sugar lactone lactonase YvrE